MSETREMDAPTFKPDLIVDAEAIIERARVEISRLCAGRGGTTSDGLTGRNWTMCVPVRADDTDMVFSALLNLARHQRERLAASPGPTESDRRDTERLDAARYRFLRERMEIRSEATLLGHFARCVSVQIGRSRIGALRDAYQQCERDDAFDAAIDAAMSSVGSSNATEEPTQSEETNNVLG